ncbi:MAG TPA: T9SS type A sorting domain-containing protein [Fluviicola sp.]|nr:T9SS type A sorting domain-containing protein [Fluviicola sp.]
MKKLLLSVSALALVGASMAQTPVGTYVNNFTLTDIDGNTQDLYTYLNAGKTVVIDVSATWCGPCWNYHNTDALNDFYLAHGPSGDNTAMALFIEGDVTTNSADLNGTGSNTQGDWVTGEDLPIIDLTTAASFTNSGLEIPYFPVMYVICPNRLVYQSGVAGAIGTLAQLNTYIGDCPPAASQPSDVSALMYSGVGYHCSGDYTPKVKIQNYGTNPLTSATITITQGGNTVSTGTYSGNLATYNVAEVTCTPIAGFTPGTLDISVTTNNDANGGNNNLSATIVSVPQVTNNLTLDIKTDFWPEEIHWVIKDAANANVAGTANPTLASDTQYNLNYILPSTGCYTFHITDDYGDGILNGSTVSGMATGAIDLHDNNNVTIMDWIDYGYGVDVPFKVVTMGLETQEVADFQIYPNPASDLVNIDFQGTGGNYAVTITDLAGRTVATQNIENAEGAQHVAVAVNELKAGNYIVTIKTDGAVSTQKVVIK